MKRVEFYVQYFEKANNTKRESFPMSEVSLAKVFARNLDRRKYRIRVMERRIEELPFDWEENDL